MPYDEYKLRKSWKYGLPLQTWISQRIIKEIVRVTKINPQETRVLEIGSGTGTLARAVTQFGFSSYAAFEPNPHLAQMTRESNGEAAVYEVMLPSTPVELLNSFDLIICVHVIEHAENGYRAREWIESLVPLLTEKGKVVVISPEVNDYKTFFWEIDWSHCFPTSCENIKQIFQDLNLTLFYRGIFRLGSARKTFVAPSKLLDFLISTKLLNVMGNWVFGRPIGTGLKAALIWGATFMIASKQ